MYTYTVHDLPQTFLLQTMVLGVIVHRCPSKSKEILKFKITTLSSEICEYINGRKKNYRFRAFTSAYDAGQYLESILTPEDKFMFHLENSSEIFIDQWYLRDSESVDSLLRSVR